MTAAIILAAGASKRMGVPKSAIPFRKGTFLSHLAGRLAQHCHPVIIVFGAHSEAVPAHSQAVVNSGWEQGQLSSLQCGLRALPAETAATIFTLVDHPDPATATILALLRSPKLIAIPVHKGCNGHPVLFRAALIPELLALSPSGSAKPLFRSFAAETDYIPVDDAGVLDDIDDPEALERFRRRTEWA